MRRPKTLKQHVGSLKNMNWVVYTRLDMFWFLFLKQSFFVVFSRRKLFQMTLKCDRIKSQKEMDGNGVKTRERKVLEHGGLKQVPIGWCWPNFDEKDDEYCTEGQAHTWLLKSENVLSTKLHFTCIFFFLTCPMSILWLQRFYNFWSYKKFYINLYVLY